jgi:hypothetical protein
MRGDIAVGESACYRVLECDARKSGSLIYGIDREAVTFTIHATPAVACNGSGELGGNWPIANLMGPDNC